MSEPVVLAARRGPSALRVRLGDMYIPAVFREERSEVIEAAMAAHPLAALVTIGSSGLDATHLPLLYYPSEGGLGVLRGHMARANPQWRESAPGGEALAIFGGPQHYVSPSWYPSKKEHGKVVPTWNYIAVLVRGILTVKDDPTWLLENVASLTERQEKASESPWRVSDAPSDFIENMLSAIVGLELKITRLEGKWKMSQNRPVADREGVISALESLDSPDARETAKLMKAALRS